MRVVWVLYISFIKTETNDGLIIKSKLLEALFFTSSNPFSETHLTAHPVF
jgi:hypothetical protein